MQFFLAETEAFLQSLRGNKPMPVTGEDGLKAMIIADAAKTSTKQNRPVKI